MAEGIDLNAPIRYFHASLRYFRPGEHHVFRTCNDDVLLLVFAGILRFSENREQHEIHPGEYYIQRHGSVQGGELASDAPQYLYVHFRAEWTAGQNALPRAGTFPLSGFQPLMEEMDSLSHGQASYIVQCAKFFSILSKLGKPLAAEDSASRIAERLTARLAEPVRLEEICREFHYSRNHVIHIFKKAYGMTPFDYLNLQRLQNAERLMEATSEPLEQIAVRCGFPSYSHFYRLFLRRRGKNPRQWRAEMRQGRQHERFGTGGTQLSCKQARLSTGKASPDGTDKEQ